MSDSPAEELRAAARLIRERAREMPPAPWRAEGRDVTATQDFEDFNPDWDMAFNIAVCRRQDEAEYIAGMHPLVALALADWLDDEADRAEHLNLIGERRTDRALAVARAYLNGGGNG